MGRLSIDSLPIAFKSRTMFIRLFTAFILFTFWTIPTVAQTVDSIESFQLSITVPGVDLEQPIMVPNGEDFILGFGSSAGNFGLAKLDDEGNVLWLKSYDFNFPCSVFGCVPRDIYIRPDGEIFVIGVTDFKFLMMRVSPDGTLRWVRRYIDLDEVQGLSIAKAEDGDLLLLGNGKTQVTPTESLLIKVDSETGAIRWSKRYSLQNVFLEYKKIISTSDGGYLLTGQFFSSSFSPVTVFTKLNNTFEPEWSREYDFQTGNITIQEKTDGSGYILYYMKGFVQTGSGGGLLEIDNNGVFVRATEISFNRRPIHMEVNADGILIAARNRFSNQQNTFIRLDNQWNITQAGTFGDNTKFPSMNYQMGKSFVSKNDGIYMVGKFRDATAAKIYLEKIPLDLQSDCPFSSVSPSTSAVQISHELTTPNVTDNTVTSNFIFANSIDHQAVIDLFCGQTRSIPIVNTDTLLTCAGDSILIGGIYYRQDTIITEQLISFSGSDSTQITQLIFNPTDSTFENLFPCTGDTLEINGNTIFSSQTVSNTFSNRFGCDSTHLAFVEFRDPVFTNNALEYCQGENITIGNTTYTRDAVAEEVFPGSNGCDSTHRTQLTFLPVSNTFENLSYCQGETATVFGQTYTSGQLINQTYTAANGCDSTHQIILQFSDTLQTFEEQLYCRGDVATIGGVNYTEDTTLQFSASSIVGCDSTHQINILFLSDTTTQAFIDICEGDTINLAGQSVFRTQIIETLYNRNNGCDSTHRININVLEKQLSNQSITACTTDSIFIDGNLYQSDTSLFLTLTASNGCDSIHQIDLQFNEPVGTFEVQTYCQGDTAYIGSSIFTTDTIQVQNLTGRNGCDSIHETTVQFLTTFATQSEIVVCDGDTVFVYGQAFFQNGSISENFVARNGCDSLHQVDIKLLSSVQTQENIQLCQGELITINNTTLQQDTTVIQVFKAANGCDSTHTIELVYLDTISTEENIEACIGDTLFIFNQPVSEAQTISQTFIADNGCDSTHSVSVDFLENVQTAELLTFCENEPGIHQGISHSRDTLFTQNLVAANSCDSTHEVTILFDAQPQVTIYDTICANENYLFYGDTLIQSGRYERQIVPLGNGCDTIYQLFLEVLPTIDYTLPAELNVPEKKPFNIPLLLNTKAKEIKWSPATLLNCTDCENPVGRLEFDQLFKLLLTTENGCSQQDSILVQVIPSPAIFAPNVFSPNQDGNNDYFTIYGNEQIDIITSLQIFDRWGGLVFSRQNMNVNEPTQGWDGTIQNEAASPGVYVYWATILLTDGTTQLVEGDLTLIR